MKTPKDVQQLAINWHVAKRILRLAMKIACCFYANQAVTPSKGWPFKFVDFITSKTGHHGKQENLQLFWRELLLCCTDQFLNIKAAPITRRLTFLERNT